MWIGGVNVSVYLRRPESLTFFGMLEDMPHFTPYYTRSWIPTIQDHLANNFMAPLTTIYAIQYQDKRVPLRRLTAWVAFSDDQSVGWLKYEGLVKGGTHQCLLYDGTTHRMPARMLMHRRRRPAVHGPNEMLNR